MTRKKPPKSERELIAEAEAWSDYKGDALPDAETWHDVDDQEREARAGDWWMYADGDASWQSTQAALRAFLAESPDDDFDERIGEAFTQLTGCRSDGSEEARRVFSVFRDAITAGRLLGSEPDRADSSAIIDALYHGRGFRQVQRRRLLRLVREAAPHVAYSRLAVDAFIRRATAIWQGFERLNPEHVEIALLEHSPGSSGYATAARISASVQGFDTDHEKHIENVKRDFKSAEEAGRKAKKV